MKAEEMCGICGFKVVIRERSVGIWNPWNYLK